MQVGGVDTGTVAAADGQSGRNLCINFTSGATPDRVTTLLRNIKFVAPYEVIDRTFDVVINDGVASSEAATVTLVARPHPPAVANVDGDSANFTEDGPAVLLDQGSDAVVTDPDFYAGSLSGGYLKASITANQVAGEDVLGIRAGSGISLGEETEDGIPVTDTEIGEVIGGVSERYTGSSGDDLQINFNKIATPGSLTRLVRSLTYSNSNTADPSTGPRQVEITLADAGTKPGITTVEVSVEVEAVNDAPEVDTNNGFTVQEGQSHIITGSELALADGDNSAGQLVYKVETAPGCGVLYRDDNENGDPDAGEELGPGDTFTQADINDSRVIYAHDGAETTRDSFCFTASDGSGGSIDSTTCNITVELQDYPPTGISISNTRVQENAAAGTVVGGVQCS